MPIPSYNNITQRYTLPFAHALLHPSPIVTMYA